MEYMHVHNYFEFIQHFIFILPIASYSQTTYISLNAIDHLLSTLKCIAMHASLTIEMCGYTLLLYVHLYIH